MGRLIFKSKVRCRNHEKLETCAFCSPSCEFYFCRIKEGTKTTCIAADCSECDKFIK